MTVIDQPVILTSFGSANSKKSFVEKIFGKKTPPQIIEPFEEVVCISNNNVHQSPNPMPMDDKPKPYKFTKIIKPSHHLSLAQCSFFSWDMLIFQIFQMSLYNIWGIPRCLKAIYNTSFGHSLPTERDVLNLLFNSSMILFVQQSRSESQTFILDCDFDPEKEKLAGGLKSIKLTFQMPNGRKDIEHGKIEEFLVDGLLTKDPQLMMGALVYFIWGYAHPKIHSTSAPLLQIIESESIQELKPSIHCTRALNKTVMSSFFSPLNPLLPYHFPISKARVVASSRNFKDLHHSGIFLFKETPYCRFLLKARSICFKHLQEVGGLSGPHCEYFFLHTVLHSLEHNIPGKYSAFRYPLPGRRNNWWNCFVAEYFRLTLCLPNINPFWSNLFKSFPKGTIYGRIYSDLAELNKEFADMVNASVLY